MAPKQGVYNVLNELYPHARSWVPYTAGDGAEESAASGDCTWTSRTEVRLINHLASRTGKLVFIVSQV